MNSVKLFLFDHGIAVPKAEQTEDKLNNLAINLIEHDNVIVPHELKQWYETHRTFDINVNNMDILGEITNNMNLKDLEQFCKTNKQYHQYCVQLLSKKVLEEQGIYLLEKPTTYKEWVDMYNRSKIAIKKTELLLNLLHDEKENDPRNYSPWLFLLISDKNLEQYKLLSKYTIYDDYDNSLIEPKKYYMFNLILNVDNKMLYYKYLNDTGKSIKSYIIENVDIYDVLYRYFYFYPDWKITDMNDLEFNKNDLIELLPELEGKLKDITLRRLEYLNYQ